MNLLTKNTPRKVRYAILNTRTPHLRTLDIERWLYFTYNRKGNQIVLDLRELRCEMYNMLAELCSCDIRMTT